MPYIENILYPKSRLLIQEIINSALPTPDDQISSGLKWVVEGTYKGSKGIYELVIDQETNTVLHFLFSSKGY